MRNTTLMLVLGLVGLLGFSGGATAGDAFTADPGAIQVPHVLGGSQRFEIEEVDPATLSCDGVITFEDVAGGPEPGTNYDVIFESDGADFAERFDGMSLSYSGDFDVLSGTPSDPLTLVVGLPLQNLGVEDPGYSDGNVIYGLGPVGYPDFDAVGEGCFAVLFDFDQSEFGFDLLGGNGGSATVKFFRRDGSLIDVITLTNLPWDPESFGFRRVGGVNDIAGITIENLDPGGIGFDNLCHDVPGVPGDPVYLDIKPTSCPNPVNLKSKGVLPVAIVGTDAFDVYTIDPETIRLEGVEPIRWSVDDVTTPVGPDAEECECNEEGPDGIMDLTVKFSNQEIVAALGEVEDGDVVPLTLTFTTFEGLVVEIVDCVWILDKGKDPEVSGVPAPPGSDDRDDGTTSWGVIKGIYR